MKIGLSINGFELNIFMADKFTRYLVQCLKSDKFFQFSTGRAKLVSNLRTIVAVFKLTFERKKLFTFSKI